MTGRVVGVVQARMSSQRLPGKVLATLPASDDANRTVLDWTVQRVALCPAVDEVVVATSDTPADDPLVAHCEQHGITYFRGALDDVLDRFYRAARQSDADTVVRVTADCPLVDPGVIGDVIAVHLEQDAEFTANRLPPPGARSYPIGLDVEVVAMPALDRAWREAVRPNEREHVMPYLYSEPGRFRLAAAPAPFDAGAVRWTVDTPADLDAVRALVRAAGATVRTGWRELLEVWQQHPELAELNADVKQRTGVDVDPRTVKHD